MPRPFWCGVFPLGLGVTLAVAPCSAAAAQIAYAAEFLPGGVNYVRTNFVDPPQALGSVMLTTVGAFADGDYAHQYWIDLALGRLHRINVFSGISTLIGDIDLQGNTAAAMHWDATSRQMLLTGTDGACESTTLYRIDLADASTDAIGTTPGCIAGLAIDPAGRAFGIDGAGTELVSIDTATGEATAVGPLELDMPSPRGLDFDPDDGSLYLFGYDETSATNGLFRVDTALGDATLVHAYTADLLAISLAPAPDSIMADGFDGLACPSGRIETSDVAYPDGTLTGVDVTSYENLWGRYDIDLPPLPFPGATTTVTVLDFAMQGYIAANAFVSPYVPEDNVGLFTYSSAPDNPHIDFSISTRCGDFSASLGACVAYDVGPDDGRLVEWGFASNDPGACVMHDGNYFFNVRVSDPSAPLPACPGDVCAIRISSTVAAPR
jgi:hypothetical protein